MSSTHAKTNTQFTSEQLAIIRAPANAHAKVIAVAGAGKTSTLIARIKQLIRQGVSADSIGVFMFNKSAQEEFKKRLAKATASSDIARQPDVMTFHSYGLKITKKLEQTGFIEPAQLIADEYTAIKVLRDSVRAIKHTSSMSALIKEEKEWLEDAQLFIEQVKASIHSPQDVFETSDLSPDRRFFPELYETFEKKRKEQKIRFFSDLIKDPLNCLINMDINERQTYLSSITPQYTHLLIDEFQDINNSQYELLKILYQHSAFWMVVGDIQQCIYEWRGADPRIMANTVDLDFNNLATYQLTQSFRFGHQIGMMATNLLAYNQSDLVVVGQNISTSCAFANSTKVGQSLLSELKGWGRVHGTLNNAAVLVRLYSDMVPIQLALMHKKIPYKLYGDSPLLENHQIRMLMAYVAVMAGGLDSPELFYDRKDVAYLINIPSVGITLEQKKTLSQQAIQAPHLIPQLLDSKAIGLPQWQSKKMQERADWLRSLTSYRQKPAKGLLDTCDVLDVYKYFEKTSSKEIQFHEKVATCDAFIRYAEGVKLSAFELLNELKELNENLTQPETETSNALHLMSIHKAKGLEFDLVIMAGLKEGRFPYYESSSNIPELIESERRLFYVGITRAKKRLVFLESLSEHDQRRLTRGESAQVSKKTSFLDGVLSRFIFETQPFVSECALCEEKTNPLETADEARINTYLKHAGRQTKEIKLTDEEARLQAGDKVKHDQFGQGVVVRQEKTGHKMIYVEFAETGFKRFNPKHTKLVKA